jgi:hypothetical protein
MDWLYCFKFIFYKQVNAKVKAKNKDLTAVNIVEASREPNNTGWEELHGPGAPGKRFFRFKDGANTCYALIDGQMGNVSLDCK